MELLPQWLQAANARGYAAPPQALPALLDAARGRTDLRPAALRFAGPRALWLARLNPDWRFALRAAPGGGPSAPDLRDPRGIRRLWQEGLFAERVTLLTALRSRDAAAARALLEETWATERAEDRLMFLDSLRAGLGPDDEDFLERGADRPQPQRTGDGRRTAVGAARVGAGRADGGAGRRVRGRGPYAGRAGDRRGGAARVRRGDGTRRPGGQGAGRTR